MHRSARNRSGSSGYAGSSEIPASPGGSHPATPARHPAECRKPDLARRMVGQAAGSAAVGTRARIPATALNGVPSPARSCLAGKRRSDSAASPAVGGLPQDRVMPGLVGSGSTSETRTRSDQARRTRGPHAGRSPRCGRSHRHCPACRRATRQAAPSGRSRHPHGKGRRTAQPTGLWKPSLPVGLLLLAGTQAAVAGSPVPEHERGETADGRRRTDPRQRRRRLPDGQRIAPLHRAFARPAGITPPSRHGARAHRPQVRPPARRSRRPK